MADKTIGDLTQATFIGHESLLVMEQQGEAQKVSGRQLLEFANVETAEQVKKATQAANQAVESQTSAAQSATQAQAAADTYPRIGSNGNWEVWNTESGAYQDTGVAATGPQGPVGPAGGVDSFNSRTGAVMPQTGDYTAEMVGSLSLEKASKYNYKTWLPQEGSKWWKIGEVDLVGSFCIQCIVYESRQSNPNRPDFSVFGLAGDFVQPPIRGSLVALIAGTDTLARIVLCNDGTIWGNRNGGYGYFNVSAVRATAATLYDTVEISADNPSGEIVWDSYDNSYVVATQQRQNITEYQNPPMQLGVEYRTTERYNEKPVYAKAVNFGALPNTSQASVAHGIQNIQSCIYVGGTIGVYNLLGFTGVTAVFCGKASIAIKTSEDLSSYSAVVILKYTKSTD